MTVEERSAGAAADAVGLTARAAAGLLALTLAFGWLLVSALPARAVTEWGVEQPASGASVSEASYVRAYARSVSGEQVDGMRVRFRAEGGGQSGQVRDLSFASGQQDAGSERSTWARPFDPLASGWHGGAPMPNGHYTVEAQAVSSVESVDFGEELHRESDWRGHRITVDAPPPATSVSAQVANAESGAVQVGWSATSVPDFRRYVVQRASAGGGFTDVHTAQDAAAVSYTDTVDGDGEYRYRVRVVRAGADGERASMSDPTAVSVRAAPDEGQSPGGDGGDGQDTGGPDAAGSPDGPGSPGATSGSADSPQLSTRSESPSTSGSQGDTRAPRTAPDPEVGTDFEPPSGDVFEENLDYDVPEGQRPQAAEQEGETGGSEGSRQSAPRGQASEPEGGRLTVLNGRELNSEEVLVPVAAGLVLTLGGMHVRRFLNP